MAEDNKDDDNIEAKKADDQAETSPVEQAGGASGAAAEVPKQSDESGDQDSKSKKDDGLDLDDDLAQALSESEGEIATDQQIDVDAAIGEVDPDFAKEMADIDESNFKGVVIDSERVSDDVDASQKPQSMLKTRLQNIPKEAKTRYSIAIAAVIILIPLAILIFMGKILPSFDLPYHITMLELSKDYHTYDLAEPEVPLFDEFKTKSFTMALPRTVINLQSSGSEPVYGEFEFFLNLREKELQQRISKHEAEIIDLLQRVLERVSWDDLQSPVGKERVKKMVRYHLNEYLEGNMVIGVYYRTVLVRK